MGKLLAGHQPHVFPGIEYFARMSAVDCWVVSDDVQFVKGDWQNRNRIKAPFGAEFITVPVLGNEKESLGEKKISYSKDSWPKSMWEKIRHAYSQCPYWKDLDWVGTLLASHPPRLIDLALPMIRGFADYLKVSTDVVLATGLGLPDYPSPSEKLAQQAKVLGCEAYVFGSQAWAYLEPEPFRERNVNVRGFVWTCPVYPQRWDKDGFVPNLSILDLVANVGPEAGVLIRKGISVGEGKWGKL